MKTAPTGFHLPDGMKIGERFLLYFDTPELVKTPQLGRLQDLRSDGALCIDVPAELSPPRGTPVTISSLRQTPAHFRFSSEILGRGRLNGRLPVLLIKAPENLEKQERRTAYRISVALKARLEWYDPGEPRQLIDCPAVVTNLSGGGAQVYLRQPPTSRFMRLSLEIPETFVEEWTRRKFSRMGTPPGTPGSTSFQHTCTQVRALFAHLPIRVIRTSRQVVESHDPFHLLSVSFQEPHEGCYRLVRFLERQAAQKGVNTLDQTAAAATAA